MNDDEAVKWLRGQVEADLSAARADCEAKLAILTACLPDASMEAALENGGISTEEYVTAEVSGAIVLRHLASAYRHRDGYAQRWGNA